MSLQYYWALLQNCLLPGDCGPGVLTDEAMQICVLPLPWLKFWYGRNFLGGNAEGQSKGVMVGDGLGTSLLISLFLCFSHTDGAPLSLAALFALDR